MVVLPLFTGIHPGFGFDFGLLICERKRPGRAHSDTLKAIPAFDFAEGYIGKGSDYALETTVSKTEHAYAVLTAHPDAAATENALIRVIGKHRIAGIYGKLTQQVPEPFGFELYP